MLRWRHRKSFKIVVYTIAAIVCVAAIAFAAFFIYVAESLSPPRNQPTAKPPEISVLEAQLRTKGSAEDALARYETVLQATADKLTQVVPTLTWQSKGDVSHVKCAGRLADTRGRRVIIPRLVANAQIPEDSWPEALQIVRDAAAELGAEHQRIYVDEPGSHDLYFYADNGGTLLGFQARGITMLEVQTDCHLRQADL